VLGVCKARGVDDYTTRAAVLTAAAESDFDPAAVQHGRTFGVFQQTDAVNSAGVPFWPTAHGTTAQQCSAFLDDFTAQTGRHTGDLVRDCWVTQRWSVPNEGVTWPDPGPGFGQAPETLNYSRRLPDLPRLLSGRI
jgi:hypothetical protein